MKKLVVAILLGWLHHGATAQLSGTYQVGPGGDIGSLSDAIATAADQGISDTTIFLVFPGGGNSELLTIGTIMGTSPETPLIIRGLPLDSGLVQLGPLYLQQAAHIRLEKFEISTLNDPSDAALRIYQGRDVIVNDCEFRVVGTPGSLFPALLFFSFLETGPQEHVQLYNCQAISPTKVFRTYGERGNIHFTDCYLQGIFDPSTSKKYYIRCTFLTVLLDQTENEIFDECVFNSPTGLITVRAHLVRNSTFYPETDLRVGVARNNVFRKLKVNHGAPLLVGNKIDSANFSFTHDIIVVSNTFNGRVTARGDRMKFYSNSFTDRFRITHGPDNLIRYNNFGPGCVMKMDFSAATLEFNSFWDLDLQLFDLMTISHNNYANPNSVNAYHASFDPWATFYDPQYTDSLGYWHATNPLLMGRATWSGGVYGTHDIDSIPRVQPGDIGANVICLMATAFPDTLVMACGDRFAPKICNGQPLLSLEPLPLNGVIDHNLIPMNSGMYLYVVDDLGVRQDSCWIMMGPFAELPLIDLYAPCGYPVQLAAFQPWSADSITWSPATMFEDPSALVQIIRSDTTVLFHTTIHNSACGPTELHYRLNITTANAAFFELDFVNNTTVALESTVHCCDSLTWSMGDGTVLSGDQVTHEYNGNGTFLIQSQCWRNGVQGNAAVYVSITSVGLEEQERSRSLVFPNPSLGIVHVDDPLRRGERVRLEVFDVQGRLVYSEDQKLLPAVIDLADQRAGQYFLRITDDQGQPISWPLILEK